MTRQNFEVLTENLGDSKLIEASAGTGKTYSIALLALRLIIEKEIPIEKILMVTFTKSAVAELESRIRKFIRLGYKNAAGKLSLPDDDNIRKVIVNSGKSVEKIRELLGLAVKGLDCLSVMTIHSFCQRTIDEYTFETNQSFNYEILSDDSDLLKKAANKYLREVLNVLDLQTFRKLEEDLKFENMYELLRKHLQGMTFIDSGTFIELSETEENLKTKREVLKARIEQEFDRIKRVDLSNKTDLGRNRKDAENFLPSFIRHCCEKKDYKYIKLFDFIYYDCGKEYAEALELKNITYLDFFRKSEELIRKIKQEKGYIFYDDQIKTVHKALDNKSLKTKLAARYLAVFIDEFQDTDSHQYEIFKTVFAESPENHDGKPLVFYIGDPKQSVYGWRGADLETYKAAKEDITDEKVRLMNVNFRSTEKMINALNVLINPGDDFNLFKDDKIKYYNVEPGASDLGELEDHGKKVKPITIWKFGEDAVNKNFKAVAAEIFRILNGDVKIAGSKNWDGKIKPKDIGVLVRDNWEGDSIKKALAEYNIPSVKRDDKKVLLSDEARMIQYLLKAVITPKRGDINRALLSRYFGFNYSAIKTIHDEKHIEIFLKLKKTLVDEGIYNMISEFLTTYRVRSICMEDVLGQRVLTNINQIAEILHKVEKQMKYTPDDILLWMQRKSGEGDEESEQRIESDEDAVQISTIHKAKGLEYKIVFAPCLSMIPKFKFLEKNRVNDFKKDGKYYFTFNFPRLEPRDQELVNLQREQENRRLVYVALTRPVYKLYISHMPRTYYGNIKESSLDELMLKYNDKLPELIEILDLSDKRIVRPAGKYESAGADRSEFSARPSPDKVIKNTFGTHSYSELSKAHHAAPFEKTELGAPEDYNQFIFQDLGRGAKVGTALHAIFERLAFDGDEKSWRKTLQDASNYWKNIIREEKLDLFMQLLKHVMNAPVPFVENGFALKKIKYREKLPELEFYFSLDKINKEQINVLLGEEADLSGKVDIEGLMTGFIDLLFENNGKYYILDWKSNHLGNSIDYYDMDNMQEAMKSSNYDLQYMIYTVAVVRWLKSRIPTFDYEKHFGGVIYVFLRGVREGGISGIYTARPDNEIIENLDAVLKTKGNVN